MLTATGMATFFGAKRASLFSHYKRAEEIAVFVIGSHRER
jgi:hypothetical protein